MRSEGDGALPPSPPPVPPAGSDPTDEADEILRLLGEHARSRGSRPRSEADLDLALRQLDARWSTRRGAETDR
jgi:hypothetical protein